MKLSQIGEAKRDPLMSLYGKDVLAQYQHRLDQVMPKQKRKHSVRVAGTLAKVSRNNDVIHAGLFHDYVERGGDIQYAATALGFSGKTIRLINLMSDENKQEGGSVLGHMQEILSDPELDEDTRNNLIIIKLADRIDNLVRRVNGKRLTDSYMRKSEELAKWLFAHYSGDPEYVRTLRKRMADLGVKIRKKHVGKLARGQSTGESLADRLGPIFGR